jgi:lysozyme
VITGIDVSHHQGVVDWAKVRGDGHAFAFVKATEGSTMIDPRFADNARRAAAAGLLVGAYHFARPDGDDAADECGHFLRTIGALRDVLTLPPVLDLEAGTGDLTVWAATFLAAVERTGRVPMLYSYGPFIRQHINRRANALAAYPLWLAAYVSAPPQPPAPWSAWSFWQHSSDGRVSGVVGRCDVNRYPGTLDELHQLAGARPTPITEPEEPEMTKDEHDAVIAARQLATATLEASKRIEARLDNLDKRLVRIEHATEGG